MAAALSEAVSVCYPVVPGDPTLVQVTGVTGGHLPSVKGQSKLKPRSPAQQTRTPAHTNDKVTDSIIAFINSFGLRVLLRSAPHHQPHRFRQPHGAVFQHR
jgi:hypothetical protein